MLSYHLLTNHKGLLLMGDYLTLRRLHDVVHNVNEASIIVKDKDGALIRLAYEIRKAYERQRRVINSPAHYEEVGIRYGFDILWPDLLVTSRMLRESMAFMETDKITQAITYNLEAVIEGAIEEDFGTKSPGIMEAWSRINPRHRWPEEKLHGRSAIFESWTKGERRKLMRGLLLSLDPMYPLLYSTWKNQGQDTGAFISPEELDSWDDAEEPHPTFVPNAERRARSFSKNGL